MENFEMKTKEWLEIYGAGNNLSDSIRKDLNIKFKELQGQYETLGDLRSFVREIYWEVTKRYLTMPKPVTVKRPHLISIRGNRD